MIGGYLADRHLFSSSQFVLHPFPEPFDWHLAYAGFVFMDYFPAFSLVLCWDCRRIDFSRNLFSFDCCRGISSFSCYTHTHTSMHLHHIQESCWTLQRRMFASGSALMRSLLVVFVLFVFCGQEFPHHALVSYDGRVDVKF